MTIEFPPPARLFLLETLADLEYNLSFGTSENLQLGALVGAFHFVKEATVKEAC